jgi:hypothetical protein
MRGLWTADVTLTDMKGQFIYKLYSLIIYLDHYKMEKCPAKSLALKTSKLVIPLKASHAA